MDIDLFKYVLNFAWTKETCLPTLRDDWSNDNKCLGQGTITALIINDIYGGKIVRTSTSVGDHYYNVIDDKIVDLTARQIPEEPQYEYFSEVNRDELLSNDDIKERYTLLLRNVRSTLTNKIMVKTSEAKDLVDNITKIKKNVQFAGGRHV